MARSSIAVVGHVWTPDIQRVFERLRREAPADYDIRFVLSTSSRGAGPELPAEQLECVDVEDLFRLPYPGKCHDGDWDIAGNLDLLFLEFRRRLPDYELYWFVEYDVHYEGSWSRFFEHFRSSKADVLATTLEYVAKVPHKLETLYYPPLVVPDAVGWNKAEMIKGFFPICRLSASLLDSLDQVYREGLCGHYEIMMPTVAALHGMVIEDMGGDGPFVRDDNRNRFYFANPASYTHSPGNFVFRPSITTVLARENTLWHPVKPAGVPLWHPNRLSGNVAKNMLEWLKPVVAHLWIRWWFATRWRPLP